MEKLHYLFTILAVLLMNIMCAVVGFRYGEMVWGAENAGYSAPPSTAFFLAVPYMIGILICVALAMIFRKKQKKTGDL